MSDRVLGIYENPASAAAAVNTLNAQGIRDEYISLIVADNVDREGFAVESHSKMAEGVALGGTGGAALGALVAGLTAVGTVATGGLGLLAAGPVVAAFTGAGLGATAGGLTGGLIGANVPEVELKAVNDALDKGSVVVAVDAHDKDRKRAAKEIFDATDAKKVVTV